MAKTLNPQDLKDLKALRKFRKKNPTIRCDQCIFAEKTKDSLIIHHCINCHCSVFSDSFCAAFMRKNSQ